MKFELPELDELYSTICGLDFYEDLEDEKYIIKHIEVDRDDNIEFKEKVKLEKVLSKYSSTEEYIRIYYNLFFLELKSQLARSKAVEMDETEKFILNNLKIEKKFTKLEFGKVSSTGIFNYSSGDLVFISKHNIANSNHKSHTLGIVEKYVDKNIHVKIVIKLEESDMKSKELSECLYKNTEWFVTRISNLATIVREYQALVNIDTYKLYDSLMHPGMFGIDEKKPSDYFSIPETLEKNLNIFFNKSQIDALKSSIKKKGVTLIQGPPGTGKSTTILGILSVILNSFNKKEKVKKILDEKTINNLGNNQENFSHQHPWIYQGNFNNWMDEPFNLETDFTSYPNSSETDCFKKIQTNFEDDFVQPEKILVCAPSNVAIDEIVNKIINIGLINSDGNKYSPKFVRIGPNYHPSIKEYSLEYIIAEKHSKEDSKDINKFKNELIGSCKIICSTLSMAGSVIMTSLNQKFDTVVIDESAQAIEISTLIPLKYGCERLILVGDPKQLAATVFSRSALNYEYHQSLFQRFQKVGYEVTMLKIQYRMHRQISKFISDTFYEGNLEDYDKIDDSTNFSVIHQHPAFQPFTYYDIESDEVFDKNSYYNDAQVEVIVELVSILTKYYSVQELSNKLAIISPYSNQVYRIKQGLRELFESSLSPIEINTVDGFQGKEKDIVIFSTVRSKGSKTIGFLSDERRMNVGLSRAKSCLIVIGDSKKLITDKNWEKLVKYAFRNATFYTVKGKNYSRYFENFEENYKKYLVKNEEEFVRIYSSK